MSLGAAGRSSNAVEGTRGGGDSSPTPVCHFRREVHNSILRIADHDGRSCRACPVDPRDGPLTWRITLVCDGGSCVKVANFPENAVIAHSNAILVARYPPLEWVEFAPGVKLGDFDDLAELRWRPMILRSR